ncbi:unnamed protein product [Cuscuta campestris]|uniref:SBP-type domain-containing protein n=1 Tax=Cuscuta campestris TaxID=132261 RepID=A0A484LWX6_9ASTE|nr:unnamed protein product [Cuscuta campestris]
MESSSSSGGALKKVKASGNSSHQVANCLVDGCDEDLSKCRDYHRRHKVCELHSKTAKVTVAGRELRFCQQCSRFHPLSEFDEGKRSCRKRLDGHNKRRRKPQPDSLNNNNNNNNNNRSATMPYSSSPQGSKQILHFGGSGAQMYANADVSNTVLYNTPSHFTCMDAQKTLPMTSSPHDYSEPNRFQLVQGAGDGNLPEASVARGVFPGGGFDQSGGDSGRALSLLSSAPAVARELGFTQPLVHGLDYDAYSHQYTFSQETGEAKHGLHFPEMFQNATSDGSSTSGGSHQTATFRWE